MNESTVEVFGPISRRNPQWFSLLMGSELIIIRITVYRNYDIVKMFQFHVPLCCLNDLVISCQILEEKWKN